MGNNKLSITLLKMIYLHHYVAKTAMHIEKLTLVALGLYGY